MTGSWVDPMQSDAKHPPPRYEHAASLVGHSLYIVGGNCGKLAAVAAVAAVSSAFSFCCSPWSVCQEIMQHHTSMSM